MSVNTQINPQRQLRAVPDNATAASFQSPAGALLAQIHPATAQTVTEALETAATAESPDYTEGILAGLKLAGRVDLVPSFIESLLTFASGVSLDQLVGRQVALGGAR